MLKNLEREKIVGLYLYLITTIGMIVFVWNANHIQFPKDFYTFLLLVFFIGVTEYLPIPIWKGTTPLSFPLVYTMHIIYGAPTTIITYGILVFGVNALLRRPLRLLGFSPAQLMLSLYIANQAVQFTKDVFSNSLSDIPQFFVFLLTYYFANNLIVDVLLVIRPQPYSWRQWGHKSTHEAIVAIFSFLYGSFMFLLGSQNRGTVDVFSFLFFFSPLVALSLISSVIVRLRLERNRLRNLFSITTELNRRVPVGEIEKSKQIIHDFLEVDDSVFWSKDQENWSLIFESGGEIEDPELSNDQQAFFEKLKEPVKYNDRSSLPDLFSPFFKPSIRSIIMAPLIFEYEVQGVIAIGRIRANSFTMEDVQSVATLANQFAVLLKTRLLISEREKRLILEERNRIAREIHDGIAQSLAGSVLNLESTKRLFPQKPEQAIETLDPIIYKLRVSLKEVRQSIYALRPNPTEQMGLKQAILDKINSYKQEHGLHIHFKERGNAIPLSPMVQKVIFETFQECLQNVIKHSNAENVDILLSYHAKQVLLRVKDDGMGFSLVDAMIKAKRDPHYGILTMNEQAEKLGASLHINSSIGKGTEIKLIIPNLELGEGTAYDSGIISG